MTDPSVRTAALDIGGAAIKAAEAGGVAFSLPFEVWRNPSGLSEAIETALRRLQPFDRLALTMTAELCDSFGTKREGVLAVLEAAEAARLRLAPESEARIFTIDGGLVDLETARAEPLACAAANWLALAIFAAREMGDADRGLAADAGSTTTDIVATRRGGPIPEGKTDTARLLAAELVYTGVRRTPVFAVADRLPYRGRECPLAAELFATMLDAYLLTGDIAESQGFGHPPTADGRPATCSCARDRLARMICADRESFDEGDALAAARFLACEQARRVQAALERVAAGLDGPPEAAVISGEGEFLLRRAVAGLWPSCRLLSFSKRWGTEASKAACAFALARFPSGWGSERPRGSGGR